MALISLVYVSFATEDMTDEELKDILEVSRENNKSKDITGMLLYRDRFFIQALEGEEEEVMPLYEAIKDDPRHRNVLLVYKNDIKSRTFSSWSMGFNKISDAQVEQMPGFTAFLSDPRDMSYFVEQPSRATTLLESFKNKTYF